MVEINHRVSGRVVLSVQGDTLENANLAGQYLIHANLQDTNLTSAALPFANLSGADLRGAILRSANLRGANLTEADMSGADFDAVDLTGATMSLTILAGCRNLHTATGLDSVAHAGPSEVDSATLADSAAYLSDIFLRSVGYTRSEIWHIRRTYPARKEPR